MLITSSNSILNDVNSIEKGVVPSNIGIELTS